MLYDLDLEDQNHDLDRQDHSAWVIWAHMTEISSFSLINEFFLRGPTERNTH